MAGDGVVSGAATTTDTNGNADATFTLRRESSIVQVKLTAYDVTGTTSFSKAPEIWHYDHPEKAVTPTLAASGPTESVGAGAIRGVTVKVLYSTWDVEVNNYGDQRITNRQDSWPEGAAVGWSVIAGDGSIQETAQCTTGPGGSASAIFIMGQADSTVIRAGVSFGEGVDNSATLTFYHGTGLRQIGSESTLSTSLYTDDGSTSLPFHSEKWVTAQVKFNTIEVWQDDYGNEYRMNPGSIAADGAPVTFSVPLGNATVEDADGIQNPVITTDANGLATVLFRFGTEPSFVCADASYSAAWSEGTLNFSGPEMWPDYSDGRIIVSLSADSTSALATVSQESWTVYTDGIHSETRDYASGPAGGAVVSFATTGDLTVVTSDSETGFQGTASAQLALTQLTGTITANVTFNGYSAGSNTVALSIDPTLDSDDDGIPDWVELRFADSATGMDASAIRYVNGETDGLTNKEAYDRGFMDRLMPSTAIATTTVVLNSSAHFNSHEEQVQTGEYETTAPPGTGFDGSGQGTYSETDPETGEVIKSVEDVLSEEDLVTYNEWKNMTTAEPEGNGTWRVQWSPNVEQVLDSNDQPVEVGGEPLLHGTWSGKTRSKSEIVYMITVADGASGSNDRLVSKPEPAPDVTAQTDGKYYGSQSYRIEGQEGGPPGAPEITTAEFLALRSAWAEIDVPTSEASRLAYAGKGGSPYASQSMDGASEDRAVFWIQTADGLPAVIPVQKTFVVTTTSSADPENPVQELWTLTIPKDAVTSAPYALAAEPGTTVAVNDLGTPSISGPTSGGTVDIPLAGMVGDFIPSIKPDGQKHFVAVKGKGIPFLNIVLIPHLVLQAQGLTPSQFSAAYDWDVQSLETGGGGVGLNVIVAGAQCSIPRDKTGHYVVSIKPKGGGAPLDTLHVWVVWADVEPVRDTLPTFGDVFAGNGSYAYSYWGNDTLSKPMWRFKFTIKPKSVFEKSGDIPDLDGFKNYAQDTPGHDKDHPLSNVSPIYSGKKADDAVRKWDVSRQVEMQTRIPRLVNPLSVSFPSDDVEGNDDPSPRDRSGADYHANPYEAYTKYSKLAHDVGQMTSMDEPKNALINGTYAQDEEGFVIYNFHEFARVQLWDGMRTNGRFWFRISDLFPWYHSIHGVWKTHSFGPDKWEDKNSKSGTGYSPDTSR